MHADSLPDVSRFILKLSRRWEQSVRAATVSGLCTPTRQRIQTAHRARGAALTVLAKEPPGHCRSSPPRP